MIRPVERGRSATLTETTTTTTTTTTSATTSATHLVGQGDEHEFLPRPDVQVIRLHQELSRSDLFTPRPLVRLALGRHVQLDVIVIDEVLFQIDPLDAHHLLPDLAPTPITPDDQVEIVRLALDGGVVYLVVVPFVFVGLDALPGVLVRLAGFRVGGPGGPVDMGEFRRKVQSDVGWQALDETQVEERSGERVDALPTGGSNG